MSSSSSIHRRNLTFYAEQYAKKLFGIRRVEDAFQRLDKFTQEEARMAAAENLTIAHRIDANVSLINQGLWFFYPSTPESVLSLRRSDVKEAKAEIRLAYKNVSELNRS